MDFLLRAHSLGRILGIEVRIGYSLYLLIGLFFLNNIAHDRAYALALLALPLFVLAHEFGHSLMARHFGVRIYAITLHALGGVAQLSGNIPGPRAEIIIAATGPIISFAFGGVFYLILQMLPPPLFLAPNFWQILVYFWMWQNLILGIFNLLPIFPLDGGRIALALAIMYLGIERGLRLMQPISRFGAAALGLYGVWNLLHGGTNGIMLIAIAALVYFQGGQEMQARRYAAQYNRY